MRKTDHIIILAIIISINNQGCLLGQTPDSLLTLKTAIDMMLSSYPSIRQADEDIDMARIKTAISSDIYIPAISGTASYMWIDPISKLTLGDKTVHIQSNHNVDFGVSINQLLWDFGKSRPKIESARIAYEITELQKQQQIKNLIIQTITAYYMTAYTRYSIDVKERQMTDYQKMLAQMEIKKNAGTATNFDFLNTGSAYNAIKTEIIALNSAKEKQYVTLSLFTDTIVDNLTKLEFPDQGRFDFMSLDSLISIAIDNRTEMKIIEKEYKLSLAELKADKRAYNPTLSAGVSAGLKNGYEPDINDIKFNYSAGATLNIPIYEVNRSKQISLGKAQSDKTLAAIELTRKQITSQVADSYLSLVSSYSKIQQLKIQQNVSNLAYKQAVTNYAAGAITNLELITASTNATSSELYLLQEQINYVIAYYTLLADIGVNLENMFTSE